MSRTKPTAAGSSSPYQLQGSRIPQWNSIDQAACEEELEEDHLEYYLSEQKRIQLANDNTLSEHDKMIIQYLACRKFHIPGNSFWEDYTYWYCNNHPFLCFCLADPRHPLGRRERIINLLASLAFGLAATCCVVLWFYYQEDRDFNDLAFRFAGIDVSVGTCCLLLFGGPLHVLFDLSIYFVQACPPCRAGGLFAKYLPEGHQKCWLWIGAHVAFLVTVAALSLAINVMLIRASIEDDGDDSDITTAPKNYKFLLLYVLEVFVANFVVFPIGTFTMFSGVLGCGSIPGLGGRPFQVKKHQRLLEKQAKKAAAKKAATQV